MDGFRWASSAVAVITALCVMLSPAAAPRGSLRVGGAGMLAWHRAWRLFVDPGFGTRSAGRQQGSVGGKLE